MAKLVRVVLTVLAIIAGPALVSLVEGRLPTPHDAGGLHLRGSLDEVSEFQLRGSR
ncbi:MAG TPA: hypothetical protein VLX44_19740 [Xanthobacteraceae bacterium]|nr:hypothetical protein [Xanthobacteraceae bacterium]